MTWREKCTIRLAELEEVLCQLKLPFLVAPCPNHEHREHPQRAPHNDGERNEERSDGDHSAELNQLTASLSGLSTSDYLDIKPSDLFPPRNVLPNDPHNIVNIFL